MRVISVMNEKGGVAKSFCGVNLAVGLAKKGNKVLFVDLDPQHNSSSMLLKDTDEEDINSFVRVGKSVVETVEISDGKDGAKFLKKILSYDESKRKGVAFALKNPRLLKAAIVPSDYENIDILCGSHELLQVAAELQNNTSNPSYCLSVGLGTVRRDYDYAVIDNSPFRSALWYNGFTACKKRGDVVIVPTKIDRESLQGLESTLDAYYKAKEGHEAMIDSIIESRYMILPTMTNKTRACRDGLELLKRLFPDNLSNVNIRYQAAPVSKSSFEGVPLLAQQKAEYCNAAVYKDLAALVEEIENSI